MKNIQEVKTGNVYEFEVVHYPSLYNAFVYWNQNWFICICVLKPILVPVCVLRMT